MLFTHRLLEDILVAYQNNSKEVQSLDYENMAAVIMLDQYCQCPACELVKWLPWLLIFATINCVFIG